MKTWIAIAILAVLLAACGPIHIRRTTGAVLATPDVVEVGWRGQGHGWGQRDRCERVRWQCRRGYGGGPGYWICVRNWGCRT